MVDDYGRYEADPELIRSKAFPFGDPTGALVTPRVIAEGLSVLAGKTLLFVYGIKEKSFLELTKWRERKRTESRYPDSSNGCLLSVADICEHLLTSPPSPPPYDNATAFVGCGQELTVELPRGFPDTIDDAIARSATIGCDPLWVTKVYNKAVGRGGRDSKDILIRNFAGWLATEWAYEREYQNKQKLFKKKNVPNI